MQQNKDSKVSTSTNTKSNSIFSQMTYQSSYLPQLQNSDHCLVLVSSSHNHIYLSVVRLLLSKLIFQEQILSKIKQASQSQDLMIIEKHTLPKHLQHIYQFKAIKSAIITTISRLEQNLQNHHELQIQVQNAISEPVVSLAYILLIRYLAFRQLQKSKKQVWIIGNEEKVIKDYREDASGNILKVISQQLKIKMTQYFYNTIARTYHINTHNQQASHQIINVIKGGKTYLMLSKKKQNNQQVPSEIGSQKLNSVSSSEMSNLTIEQQPSIQLLSETSSVSITAQIKVKNCPKCGRVKTQKFCICRKGRDESVSKGVSKFQAGIVTSNCKKCFLSRAIPNESYCRQCKVKINK